MTGLFAIAALAGLILMLIFFGELSPLAQRNYEFQLRVANAGGLDDTSPVLLNGVKVGQVTLTKVTSGETPGAMLNLTIRQGIEIPRASKISVDRGFVGGSSLEFLTIDLSTEQRKDVVRSGEVIDGGAPETLLGSIKSLAEGPLQQLSATAEKIDTLALEYTQLGKRLNELVEPRTLADVAGGKPANLRSSLERFDTAVASANTWLADEAIREQFKALLSKADKVMNDAGELAKSWTATSKTVETTVADAGGKLNELAEQANASLAKVQAAGDELTKVLEAINSGKGTMGQLVNNPDLYRNLDDASVRLNKALDEATQLIEKYKAEGIKLKL
jgi:phospholipid/cholesterol/gamma-HCH transport system substrate-binding protein